MQAESLGIPLNVIFLSDNPSNEEYEQKMNGIMTRYKNDGVNKIAFGDIFLEDLKKYREGKLAAVGMEAVFPLWRRDTKELSSSFCKDGFKSVITCVDTQVLDKKYLGRSIDTTLLSELPESVDKCGENGEYHSFAYEGPIFHKRVGFKIGEKVLRDNRFYFCDLIPQKLN